MNHIDRVELRIPLSQLVHDVPVERGHVNMLKLSIQQVGQLSPLLVWERGNDIIDGFHRLEALRELGGETALCSLMDLSLEQFRDARITSAVTHKGVSFPRVVKWARETFADTLWASRIKTVQAFQLDRQLQSPKGTKRALREGLSMDEIQDILGWVKGKSQVWGLQPLAIANMLDLADLAAPSLIPLVRQRTQPREEVLTRPMLRAIVEEIPDHQQQEAIARKAMVEKLKEDEVRDLVVRVQRVQTPEEKQIILSTNWLDMQEQERKKSEEAAKKSLPKTEEERKRREERFAISMYTSSIDEASGALEKLSGGLVDKYPDLKRSLSNSVHFLKLNLERLSGENRSVIEELQSQITSLTRENQDYKYEITRLNHVIQGYQRRIGIAQRIEEENRLRD